MHEWACGAMDDRWLEQIVSHCTDSPDTYSDVGNGGTQPMKVQLGTGAAEVEPSLALPMKVESNSSLAYEDLAQENLRLSWENKLLRHQSQQHEVGTQLNPSAECWWPQSDSWAAADYSQQASDIQLGDCVCFQGLQHSVELNGAYATVDRWDDVSGRWVVYLATGEEKFAKPDNLAKVPLWDMQWTGNEAASGKAFAKQQRKRAKRSGSGAGGPTGSFGSESTASTSIGSSISASSITGDEGQSSGETEMTTVMMRNIPNDYTGAMLTELLDKESFGCCYNLVYLPMDYCRKAAFGYAFIDLVSHEEAKRFHRHFEGFMNWDIPCSQKVCSVGWSDALQGVQAHVDRYRNSPVMHEAVPDEFKPMMFIHGRRVPFPAPTKNVRAPRLRKHEPAAHRPGDAAVLPVGALC